MRNFNLDGRNLSKSVDAIETEFVDAIENGSGVEVNRCNLQSDGGFLLSVESKNARKLESYLESIGAEIQDHSTRTRFYVIPPAEIKAPVKSK